MWNRREFCVSLGALAACNRATITTAKEDRVQSTHHPMSAPPVDGNAVPTAARLPAPNEDPGFTVLEGPASFVLDGDRLLELRAGAVVVRDFALTETATLPVTGAVAFAVLPDHSVLVRVAHGGGSQLQHVVNKIATTYDDEAGALLPTESATEVWTVTPLRALRSRFGTGSLAGMIVAGKGFDLPEGTLAARATLVDGSLAVSHQMSILRITPTAAVAHPWTGFSRHLGPGPDSTSVWVSVGLHAVALVSLAAGDARAVITHALKPDETIVHLASYGAHVAAVIAHGLGTGVTFSLAVFDAKGEQWRAALGAQSRGHAVAVSERRVVVQSGPTFRSWDVASGTETAPARP